MISIKNYKMLEKNQELMNQKLTISKLYIKQAIRHSPLTLMT